MRFVNLLSGHNYLAWGYFEFSIISLKSVHFKNPVAGSSFLSKSLSFSIQHQLNQNKVSWCYIENDNNFESNEDCTTVFLKWRHFKDRFLQDCYKIYWLYIIQNLEKWQTAPKSDKIALKWIKNCEIAAKFMFTCSHVHTCLFVIFNNVNTVTLLFYQIEP